MNRIEAQGLAVECIRGGTVLLILGDASNVLQQLVDAFPANEITRVRRSAGAQEIGARSGGRLIIRSARSSGRGISADVVYIDDAARPDLDELVACVAASGGDVIRA